MPVNTIESLLGRIESSPDGCWLWTGHTTCGYGRARFDGRPRPVHRILFEHFVGPIPEGLQIDHLCRNRACSRPSHLELVTVRENVLRGVGHSAQNARKETCSKGHDLVYRKDSTRTLPRRYCKECENARQRAKRAMAC